MLSHLKTELPRKKKELEGEGGVKDQWKVRVKESISR